MNSVYRSWFPVSIGVLLFHGIFSLADDILPTGTNAYQMVTGDSSDADRKRWDRLYSTKGYVFGKEPASFLKNHISFLPPGKVLDIAMGEGRNAVFLAKADRRFSVDGVDISEVALRKAKRLAKENGVSVKTIIADLNSYKIPADSYQVILNFDYLQRSLIPEIKKGLKKRGIVVYENQTVDQLLNPGGEKLRRDYLLKKGELKDLFKDFEILAYREINDGKEARASLIARKP